MNQHKSITLAVLLLAPLATLRAADVANLRCEYLENPLGIDTYRPRLSWKPEAGNLKPEKGVNQASYQVLVASVEELLKKDEGDLWDSGKVASDQSDQVEYAGKPLESRMRCYWKARIWDQTDKASEWSKPAFWTMGLLKPDDFTAQWITASKWFMPPDVRPWGLIVSAGGWADVDLGEPYPIDSIKLYFANPNTAPLLRKTFSLQKPVKRATMYVAALGMADVSINGRPVTDTVLEPRFMYLSGPLELEVKGLTGPLAPDAVTIRNVQADLKMTGTFACSNPFLNQVYDALLRTHLNYNGDQPMDPMREKQGWTQDVQSMFETSAYLTDVGGLYRKWWWNFADGQDESGYLGSVLPLVGRQEYGWNSPWWSGVVVWLPWQHDQYYGDRRMLADAYDTMRRYVDFLGKLTASGSVRSWDDYPYLSGGNTNSPEAKGGILSWMGAGDWQNPYGGKDAVPAPLLDMPAWYDYATIVSDTAALLGKKDDAAKYAAIAEGVKNRFNNKYLNRETGLYGSQTDNQTAQVLPLALGVVPAEGWEGGGAQMPSCGGAIGMWLYQSVLGIRPDPAGPGFKKFILAPQPDPATGLTSAHGSYDSVHGRIVTDWACDNGKFSLHTVIPANITATIFVPAKDAAAVIESGKPADKADGVKFLRMEKRAAVYEVGSGTYHFQTTMSETVKQNAKESS